MYIQFENIFKFNSLVDISQLGKYYVKLKNTESHLNL